jgi:hypothetical protein
MKLFVGVTNSDGFRPPFGVRKDEVNFCEFTLRVMADQIAFMEQRVCT